MKVKSESEVAQLCLTLSDPMDCSLPGSSAHGIFQARVLEWGAIAFSDQKLGIPKTSTLDEVIEDNWGQEKKGTRNYQFKRRQERRKRKQSRVNRKHKIRSEWN